MYVYMYVLMPNKYIKPEWVMNINSLRNSVIFNILKNRYLDNLKYLYKVDKLMFLFKRQSDVSFEFDIKVFIIKYLKIPILITIDYSS